MATKHESHAFFCSLSLVDHRLVLTHLAGQKRSLYLFFRGLKVYQESAVQEEFHNLTAKEIATLTVTTRRAVAGILASRHEAASVKKLAHQLAEARVYIKNGFSALALPLLQQMVSQALADEHYEQARDGLEQLQETLRLHGGGRNHWKLLQWAESHESILDACMQELAHYRRLQRQLRHMRRLPHHERLELCQSMVNALQPSPSTLTATVYRANALFVCHILLSDPVSAATTLQETLNALAQARLEAGPAATRFFAARALEALLMLYSRGLIPGDYKKVQEQYAALVSQLDGEAQQKLNALAPCLAFNAALVASDLDSLKKLLPSMKKCIKELHFELPVKFPLLEGAFKGALAVGETQSALYWANQILDLRAEQPSVRWAPVANCFELVAYARLSDWEGLGLALKRAEYHFKTHLHHGPYENEAITLFRSIDSHPYNLKALAADAMKRIHQQLDVPDTDLKWKLAILDFAALLA